MYFDISCLEKRLKLQNAEGLYRGTQTAKWNRGFMQDAGYTESQPGLLPAWMHDH